MSEFFCTRCLLTEDQVYGVLSEGAEIPGLGLVRNPLLTECCKEGWGEMPKRGKQRFRIALRLDDRGAFVSSGIARYTESGTPYCRGFDRARLWEERKEAERWIKEHPLERKLRPRIEELYFTS